MSAEENKAIVRRLTEAITVGDMDVIDQLVARDCVYVGAPENRQGIDGLKETLKWSQVPFPDLRSEIQDIIAEDDKVWVHYKASGTHQGEFEGVPPTNKAIWFGVVRMYRLSKGKVVEHHGVAGINNVLRQTEA